MELEMDKKSLRDFLKKPGASKMPIPTEYDLLCWNLILNRARMATQLLVDWAKECIRELEQLK